MYVAGLFVAVIIFPRSVAAVSAEHTFEPSQAVVLLRGRSMLEQRLPAFIQVQPGRYLASSALRRACMFPRPQPDSVLMFLPESRHCEQITPQQQVALRQRLRRLTGRWPTEDPLASLGDQPFLAIAPAQTQAYDVLASCSCPNQPPDGAVMCTVQTRTAGKPIATVEYDATDPDGDPLNGTFTYQYGIDPVQAGLPSSLTSSCTPVAGSLQCTVDGNAPAQTGDVQLMLTVSDGISTPDLNLTSLLHVISATDRIFDNDFEDPNNLTCSQ